ncbi:MAG: MFS transporter [Elusimicrobia bacterium]|nr:MFS transporter [Elusimicrobiota bacterium]
MTAVLEAARPAAAINARRAPLGGFLGGVLISQIVNNALHLAQPLLMSRLTGSLGWAAFFASAETGVHMGGTFLGGWPCDKLGPRRLLILSTLLRGVSLSIIPVAWALGLLTIPVAVIGYTLDALVRGLVDTSVHTLPLELAERDRAELDRLNARYELAFDIGGVIGPVGLAVLMTRSDSWLPHAVIAGGFVLSALVFGLVPRASSVRRAPKPAAAPERGGTWEGLKLVLADPALRWSCLGLALLNLYPLRKLMSAFFAKAILMKPAYAGWVGAAFGLGGIMGSLIFSARGGRTSGRRWIAAGAIGTLALATAWIPGSLSAMVCGVFVFATLNAAARLSMTGALQDGTPLSAAGGVTAVARGASNAASVALKFLLAAAFALGAAPRAAFAAVGAGLAVIAVVQLILASRLARLRI